MASPFTALPLGQRIPASPHAVSCSLPTMRDVCGYEERDAEIVRQVPSGYPRFIVHPFARALGEHFAATDLTLADRTLWLTSSARMAEQLLGTLPRARRRRRALRDAAASTACRTRTLPALADRAKTYLQHVGGFLSSREAEDHLVRLALRPSHARGRDLRRRRGGDRQGGTGPRHARLLGCRPSLANCGMNAMHAAFRAVSGVQARAGPHGLDANRLALPRHHRHPAEVHRRPGRLPLRARRVRHGGTRPAVRDRTGRGWPASSPRCPPIPSSRRPTSRRSRRSAAGTARASSSIRPSSSVYNVDVLPHADVVACSLTKYTASDGRPHRRAWRP